MPKPPLIPSPSPPDSPQSPSPVTWDELLQAITTLARPYQLLQTPEIRAAIEHCPSLHEVASDPTIRKQCAEAVGTIWQLGYEAGLSQHETICMKCGLRQDPVSTTDPNDPPF